MLRLLPFFGGGGRGRRGIASFLNAKFAPESQGNSSTFQHVQHESGQSTFQT